MRNLILTGGWAHDFERTAPILAEVLDVDSVLVDDVAEAGRRLRNGAFDTLTVYACRFRMLDSRYSDEVRATWARTTPDQARRDIAGFLGNGGGLLAVHTASICFDDWPQWPGHVGGAWVWGRSWHPPIGPVDVAFSEHEPAAGLGAMAVTDERYCDLDLLDGSTVLACSPGATDTQPLAWVRPGTIYDALGHDERSLTHPTHAEFLRRAIRWVGRR